MTTRDHQGGTSPGRGRARATPSTAASTAAPPNAPATRRRLASAAPANAPKPAANAIPAGLLMRAW
ncbi:hypothetical protein GCM10027087_75310 [Paractinoplanes abujensis]